MGIHRPLLIALALLLLTAPAAAAPNPGCVRCHPPHYEDRGRCSYCHRGNESAGRAALAHLGLHAGRYSFFRMEESAEVRKGGELLEALGCRRCHVSGGKGNSLSSDLDALPLRSAPERIAEAIRVPAYYMPDFRLGEERIDSLVNAILAASAKGKKAAGEIPVRVHFREEAAEDAFAGRCGPCHKALTERYGGLGQGSAGPNVSALFSPYYPKFPSGGKPWTAERLWKWIANPRKERPAARMPPLRLKEDDFLRIEERLQVTPREDKGK